jgi:sodium/potassium/calcium exchanger 6
MLANEVVTLLTAIGLIMNISEAILGLTIFAIGNSTGDLVANLTIARMGFPNMAVAACFGSPMLSNFLTILFESIKSSRYFTGSWHVNPLL